MLFHLLIMILPNFAASFGVEQPDGGNTVLGIRYAQPSKRFGPAVLELAPASYTDKREKGPICWQDDNICNTPGACSEDCLYLNVYRPGKASPNSNLPVLVYIHGGGMVSGSGMAINGSQLATSQDILVVSVNYRLGPLGFFSHDKLKTETGRLGGMNGQLDQITALKWVQKNIGPLGGDPSRVSIAGCSAGGLSVCSLMVSPMAKGLFKNAIIQAGACNGPWGPGSAAYGLRVSVGLIDRIGAPQDAPLEKLREASPQSLTWGWNESNDIEFPGYFLDGAVLPAHPRELIQKELYLNVDKVLAGGTSRDGVAVWYDGVPTTAVGYFGAQVAHWTTQVMHTLIGIDTEGLGAKVAKQYPLSQYNGHWGAAYLAADGDYNVICPTQALLQAIHRQGVSTYQYYFTAGPRCSQKPMNHAGLPEATGWAWHCDEELFLFGVDPQPCGFSAQEMKLKDWVQTIYGRFIKCGDPNMDCEGDSGSEVSPYPGMSWEPGPDKVMLFRHLCRLWVSLTFILPLTITLC